MTRKSLTAIIPAAGLGTRLRPLTYSRPKALLPLAGKPMIGYVLEAVRELGASRVVLIVGHLAGQVAQYVKENFTSGVVLVEQKQFLGLGHAIFQAAGSVEDEALIFLGDTLVEGDFTRHIGAGYSWLAVKEVEDPRPFGVVVTDRAGWIRNLVEKPATPVSRKAIVGVYYLRNSRLLFQCLSDLVTGDIRTRGEYQLTDAIQMMVQRGEKIRTVPVEKWYDCGRVETLLQTNQFFLQKYCRKTPQISGAVITPPVYFGPEVKITGGRLGPHVALSRGVVATNCVLRNVIVDEGAHLEDVWLEDSVVGQRTRVTGFRGRLNIGDDAEVSAYR